MSLLQTIVDYYVARLASIYRSKPKASAQTALFVKQMLADNLASELNAGFDLDQAVGDQLDTLGKYIGVSRDVQVADTRPYFGFVSYGYPAGDQNQNGFVSYQSIALNASGVWYEYEFVGKSVSQLTDYQYTQLLAIKIVTNSSDNTMASIQEQIELFFNGVLRLRDNKDMTMAYFYGASIQLPLSVLENCLPRPMGVGINVLQDIAWDMSVDAVAAFTSETPSPIVSWGDITSTTSKAFVLTNVTDSDFTVVSVTADSVFSLTGTAPALPLLLAKGESVTLTIECNASTIGNFTGELAIFVSSEIGLSVYTARLTATVSLAPVTANLSLLLYSSMLTDNPSFVMLNNPGGLMFELYSSLSEIITVSALNFTGGVSSEDTPPILAHEYGGTTIIANVAADGTMEIIHSGANSPFVVDFQILVM